MTAWLTRCALFLALLRTCSTAYAEPTEPPEAEPQSEYKRTMELGIFEFEAGRYAEARAIFLRAHEMSPSARTLRTLGMTAFDLRMYPRAVEELSAALADERKPLRDEHRKQVTQLLQQAQGFVGRFHLRLEPPDAQLQLDGERIALAPDAALVLAVGEHELRFRAPGFAPLRVSLHVQGREDELRTFALEPIPVLAAAPAPLLAVAAPTSDAPSGRARLLRVGAYASAGLAASALVVGGVFGGLAVARDNSLEGSCPSKACGPGRQDDIDQLRRFANTSTVGLAVGVTAGVLATVLWIRARSTARAEHADTWTLNRMSF
jgi:tetratricopeptide (TPR) repeat protein